jgi:hypothetical protein
MRLRTLADINRRNDEFWAPRNALLRRACSNDEVRELAVEILQHPGLQVLPPYVFYYPAFELAEKALQRFASALARKGGRAAKRDSLQRLIERIVRDNPAITECQLLAEFRSRQIGRDVIDDIDEQDISFFHCGRTKVAPLSGLKDRLSRAKKQIRSR